jgi:succinate dehydrogenase / fumarate reductase membrane anchor subunit
VLVGVHRIDMDYVALRWATLGWRVYDMALLGFAFAHGMNGLRQVLEDYITRDRPRRLVRWGLFAAWLVVTAIGAAAIVGGVGRAAGGASGS